MKHVHTDRDRRGNVRVYYQAGRGAPKIRLRSPVGTPEFMEEYRAASNAPAKLKKPLFQTGTFGAMITAYYESPEFCVELKSTTQTVRRRILDKLKKQHGHKLAKDTERRHILDLRNEKGLGPHAANNRLKALKALFRWALDAGYVDENPTREVNKIKAKTDGHPAWTEDEIARFLKRHPKGTKARLAFNLLFFTACRKSDVVTLGRQLIQSGILRYRVNKTGEWASVRVAQPIWDEVAHLPADQMVFLLTEHGRAFTVNGFGNWFRKRCDEADVSKSAHGLRKSGPTIAANRGATTKALQAFGVWASLDEVNHYTESANREKLAGDVVTILERMADK